MTTGSDDDARRVVRASERTSRERFRAVMDRDGAGGGWWLRFGIGSHVPLVGAILVLLNGHLELPAFGFLGLGVVTSAAYWVTFKVFWDMERFESAPDA